MVATANQWSKFTGIKAATIRYRVRNGWLPERAVTEKATMGNNKFLTG
jgi:hypothetical protein